MLNQVTIQGRLTADPELKKTAQGTSVTSFTLACDRDYQSSGDKKTDFIDFVAWRVNAEFICRNFHKGKMMLVTGRLEKRNYKAQDGTNRYVTEVVVEEVYFAGDKPATNTANNNGTYSASNNGKYQSSTTYARGQYSTPTRFSEIEDDSELPF